MASNTPNLKLLKKDPLTDGDDTFNIQTMLNDNWDKIDAAVGEVKEKLHDLDIPPASLTQAGITQLSSDTDSPAEDKAATPNAVKVAVEAATAAQSKADQAFQLGNERKAEVVAALVALGVSASTNDSWDILISKMATVIKATGNAAVGDVLAGKTFSNAGANGLIGTMSNQGARIITPGTANQTIAAGYHNGSGYVKGDANIIADNLPKDKTIFGVTGLLERLTTADKTSIANQITNKGVPASVNDSPAQLAGKIGQIETSVEDTMQEASDILGRILAYPDKDLSTRTKITLDKNKNVLIKKQGSKIIILNKNMVPLYELTEIFLSKNVILAPDGQHFYSLYSSSNASDIYSHSITKYTVTGTKVWETPKVSNSDRLWTLDFATNGDIIVCLWNNNKLDFLDASNGGLMRTITASYCDNVLWDDGLGMFVCRRYYGEDVMVFVRTDGSIYKTAENLWESETERRHLSVNVYKYIYGRELYSNTKF